MHQRAGDLPLDPHPDRLRQARPHGSELSRPRRRARTERRLRRDPEARLLDEAEHGEEAERPERPALDEPEIIANEHLVEPEDGPPAEEIAERCELLLEPP